jgi:hypothetical protein
VEAMGSGVSDASSWVPSFHGITAMTLLWRLRGPRPAFLPCGAATDPSPATAPATAALNALVRRWCMRYTTNAATTMHASAAPIHDVISGMRCRAIHTADETPSHGTSHTPPQSTPPSAELLTPSVHVDSAPGRKTQLPPATSRMWPVAQSLQSSPVKPLMHRHVPEALRHMPCPLHCVCEATALELTNDAAPGHALRVMGQSTAQALAHSAPESTQSSPVSHTELPHSAPQPVHVRHVHSYSHNVLAAARNRHPPVTRFVSAASTATPRASSSDADSEDDEFTKAAVIVDDGSRASALMANVSSEVRLGGDDPSNTCI